MKEDDIWLNILLPAEDPSSRAFLQLLIFPTKDAAGKYTMPPPTIRVQTGRGVVSEFRVSSAAYHYYAPDEKHNGKMDVEVLAKRVKE